MTLVSLLLQGDVGGADRTKKPESTSSYNYRVVKEVRVQGGSYQKAFSHAPNSPHTHPRPPPDPAETQQVVCPRRSVRQEEQETAAEAAEEHGGPRRRSGAPTDPIREGIECFHSCEIIFSLVLLKYFQFCTPGRRFAHAGHHEISPPVSTELLCRKPAEPSPAAQAYQSLSQPRGE